MAPGSAWWTSIEKPDKYTIILTSEKPRPGVFDFLNFLRIQDKDVRDGPDGTTKVGGTGPFKWVEWVPGDHINMVKNKNYWDSGHPYVDEYKIKIFRDQQSMVAALEAGTLDVAALAPIPDAARLKDDPKYQIFETHGDRAVLLRLRQRRPPRPTTRCCARRSATPSTASASPSRS